jgi:hypothetical protein
MEQTDVQARQAADAEEMRWGPWVEWKGGECPVDGSERVQARLHGYYDIIEREAGRLYWEPGRNRTLGLGSITAYRVLKTAAKPAEPAALPLPASDLPGIAKQQAWLAAQPVPVPPPAPTPKEHPGLATVAPLSGRVGGRWGV